jgi:serine/threonine-protein kinase
MEESAGTFRLTSSLVNQRGETIGARTVTGDRANLMALEDQLATKAFEILPQVARLEVPAPSNVQASEHPEGYEYYVRGRGDLLDYQKPENIDSAIAHFDKALSKSPNYAPAYAGLGEAYWIGYEAHRGKSWLDLATTNCQKALEADPKLAEGHICLGNVYVDKGRYDVAVDQFQRALAIDSNSAEAFNGLAEAYDKQGNAPAAEETYKKAIAARPQYWAVYNWLGAFYGTRARYADAVPMFEKVIQLTPDNQRGYYNLGAVLVMEGKYDEAVESLNHSIKLRPTMSAYSNLGAAYFWQHRYADAIPAFEKARDLDDKDYQNWGNLADALYWSPNRRSEATAAYKRAIELAQSQVQVNSSDATARAYIAEYSAMVGDKLTATKEIRHALETAPQDSDVMFRAALVYNQLGDRRRTLDYLKNALGANYSRTAIRDTPDFSHLQTDPEFQALGVGK